MKSIYLLIVFLHQCYAAGIMDNVVFAVNCGGEAHTDANGKLTSKEKYRLIGLILNCIL